MDGKTSTPDATSCGSPFSAEDCNAFDLEEYSKRQIENSYCYDGAASNNSLIRMEVERFVEGGVLDAPNALTVHITMG